MEELKLILEAISQLGESGKEAFIYWLMADKGVPVILSALWIGAIVTIVKLSLSCLYSMQEATRLLIEIRSELLPHNGGYLTKTEIDRLRTEFRRFLNKEK